MQKPNKIKAFFRILRPVNALITAVTVIVAGIIVKPGELNWSDLLLSALAAAMSAGAGNVINDIFDVETDRINRPERPLPSGLLRRGEARVFYCLINLLALISALFVSMPVLLIVIASQVLIFLYSFRLKSVPLAGNVSVAFLTALTVIFGAIAAGGSLGAAIIPAVFAFFINLIREIVKDIEDMEGDRRNGVLTLPIKYGVRSAKALSLVLGAVLILLTTLPYFAAFYKIEYFIVVMSSVNVLLAYCAKVLMSFDEKKYYSRTSRMLKLAMALGLLAVYLGNQ